MLNTWNIGVDTKIRWVAFAGHGGKIMCWHEIYWGMKALLSFTILSVSTTWSQVNISLTLHKWCRSVWIIPALIVSLVILYLRVSKLKILHYKDVYGTQNHVAQYTCNQSWRVQVLCKCIICWWHCYQTWLRRTFLELYSFVKVIDNPWW